MYVNRTYKITPEGRVRPPAVPLIFLAVFSSSFQPQASTLRTLLIATPPSRNHLNPFHINKTCRSNRNKMRGSGASSLAKRAVVLPPSSSKPLASRILIDTLIIRNEPNPCRINTDTCSNRYKTGPRKIGKARFQRPGRLCGTRNLRKSVTLSTAPTNRAQSCTRAGCSAV